MKDSNPLVSTAISSLSEVLSHIFFMEIEMEKVDGRNGKVTNILTFCPLLQIFRIFSKKKTMIKNLPPILLSSPSSPVMSRGKKLSPEAEAAAERARVSPTHPQRYHTWKGPEEVSAIQSGLLAWYDKAARVLPWRERQEPEVEGSGTDDNGKVREQSSSTDGSDGNGAKTERDRGYDVWVSEVMLQQTRVETVITYYERWMKKWPKVADLAGASSEEVNEAWKGLGFYRRCRFLWEGAQEVVSKHGGVLPRTASGLRAIKGIGAYTAGAIASIAYRQSEPAVDGNVIRVLSRVRAISADPTKPAATNMLWDLAGSLAKGTPGNRPGDMTQALMELGATVCTPTPSCNRCPISQHCHAFNEVASNKGQPLIAWSDGDGATSNEDKPCTDCTLNMPLEQAQSLYPSVAVTKYPRKVMKAAPRPMLTAVTVVVGAPSKKVFLVKRPEQGLLGNLFEFPAVEMTEDPPGSDPEKWGEIGVKDTGEWHERRLAAVQQLLVSSWGMPEDSVKNAVEGSYRVIGTLNHQFTHISQTLLVGRLVLDDAVIDTHIAEGLVEANELGESKGTAGSTARWVARDDMTTVAISTGMKKVWNMFLKPPARPSASVKKAKKSPKPAPAPPSRTMMSFFKPKPASESNKKNKVIADADDDDDDDSDEQADVVMDDSAPTMGSQEGSKRKRVILDSDDDDEDDAKGVNENDVPSAKRARLSS